MTEVILAFLRASGRSLEWTTREGRTFQICGFWVVSCWERFFRSDQHPTRTRADWTQIQSAWANVAEPLTLYSLRKDEEGAERLTREQILDRVEEMFPDSARRT